MNAHLGKLFKRIDPIASQLACAVGSRVGKLCRSQHASAAPLIVRPGGMGDLICAHLALERVGVPADDVEWLIETRSEPWARHARLRYQCIESIAEFPLLSASRRLVIDTEQRFGLSLALSLALRAPGGALWAFSTNRASRWADNVTAYDPYVSHEVVAFSELFAAAFNRPLPKAPKAITRRQPVAGGLVVGIAGRQEPTRSLPLSLWVKMVRHWSAERPFTIVAAPVDLSFAKGLMVECGSRASLHEGDFSSACNLIASSEELFTIDGGLVHVGSYYGVPTTAVFTSGRDGKWAPLASGSKIIRRTDLQCQPCTMYGQVPRCCHALACHELHTEIYGNQRPVQPCTGC